MAKHPNALDWTPLLPHMMKMMVQGVSITKMSVALGVSFGATSDAIKRYVSPEAIAEWRKRVKAGGKAPVPPRLQKTPDPGPRQPFEAGSAVTWGAIWGGNPPPYPTHVSRLS